MSPWVVVLTLIVALVVLAYAHAELRRLYRSLQASLPASARPSTSPAPRHSLSRREVSQQEYRDSLNQLGFRSLREYRMSESWQQTKRRYRRSDYPQRCLICGSNDFDLHHRSYARLGDEELFDLVPLCRQHHDQLHALLDQNPNLTVKDTHDYLVFLMEDKEGPDTKSQVAPSQAHVPATPRKDGQAAGTPAKVRQKRRRDGKTWSPEEDAALLRGFDQGMSVIKLAERFHRGSRAVEVRLSWLGRLPWGGWQGRRRRRKLP